MNVRNLILSLLLLNFSSVFADKVGLLVMATGKYIMFVDPLIKSAEKYFCRNHEVSYFVFTNAPMVSEENPYFQEGKITYIYQPRLGWPYDTMMRYHVYYKHRDILASQDYLFASDADMLFVDEVGDEILGERVATMHPGFVNKRGSYDTNPKCLAYISDDEGEYYFAGGFYGGTSKEMMQIAKTNLDNIDDDLARGIIAVWHDESHWNRYCIDHPPTVILTPSYCYPERWNIPYKKRLLALDKNHQEFQRKTITH
jgi:histo-blood group ABO system transferase